jgi:hypothetical protein
MALDIGEVWALIRLLTLSLSGISASSLGFVIIKSLFVPRTLSSSSSLTVTSLILLANLKIAADGSPFFLN